MKNVLAPVGNQIPKWFDVKPKKLNPDRKFELVSSIWGFVEPNGITGENFDICFLKCEDLFWDSFERLEIDEYNWVRESVEDEEGGYESPLHYLAKIFVVKYLEKKFGKELGITSENITEKIKTENPLEVKEKTVYPDVYLPDKNLVIEIETLYGSGVARCRRLKRTMEKYEGLYEKPYKGPKYKLWLVVPNLQMALYQKCIQSFVKRLKEKPVKFYTLNVKSVELVEHGMNHKFLK